MKKITIWERYVCVDKEKKIFKWKHNHIEDGWSTSDIPIPKFKSQMGWLKGAWRKKHGELKDGKVYTV